MAHLFFQNMLIMVSFDFALLLYSSSARFLIRQPTRY